MPMVPMTRLDPAVMVAVGLNDSLTYAQGPLASTCRSAIDMPDARSKATLMGLRWDWES